MRSGGRSERDANGTCLPGELGAAAGRGGLRGARPLPLDTRVISMRSSGRLASSAWREGLAIAATGGETRDVVRVPPGVVGRQARIARGDRG